MTSETSYTFTPSKTGVYTLWVDVQDSTGKKVTSDSVELRVAKEWKLDGMDLSSSVATVGDTVSFTVLITGPTGKLSYNLAWSYEGGWDDWSSTLKETGDYTTNPTSSFKAKKAGTYFVWADIKDSETGEIISTGDFPVTVNPAGPQGAWTLKGLDAPTTAKFGDPVTFSAIVEGDTNGLMYNYAWNYENMWGENWSSTIMETGAMTSNTSWTFTPSKTGVYTLWVDVEDKNGKKVTSEAVELRVAKEWKLNGMDLSSSVATVGDTVTFKILITGPTGNLSYNLAWSYGDGWDDWSSTLKETGDYTTNPSSTFVARKTGTYYVWADIKDAETGEIISTGTFPVEVKGTRSVSLMSAAPAVEEVPAAPEEELVAPEAIDADVPEAVDEAQAPEVAISDNSTID